MDSTLSKSDCHQEARIEEARRAHARNWLLTPTSGKAPYLPGWSKAQPPSLEDVEAWASEGNLAVRTGPASGIVIIDDDTDSNEAQELLTLPVTPTVETGGGHRHYYFSCPDEELRNSASKLADNIDVRGAGGAAVYPGSVHPETGALYQWLPGLSPEDVPLAAFPEHLLSQLRKPVRPPVQPSTRASRRVTTDRKTSYAEAAVQNATDRVRLAEEGSRNHVLNSESFGLGKLVGAELLAEGEARERLSEAGQACGLLEREYAKTIESGLSAGMQEPFNAPWDAESDGGENLISTDDSSAELDAPLSGRTILVVPGGLSKAIDQTADALDQSRKYGLYQRGTELVRIVRTGSASIRGGISRPRGALSIHSVVPPYLMDLLTRAIRYQRLDKQGYPNDIDCPMKVVRSLLAKVGEWTFDELVGVIEAPTLRRNGTLLSDEGYDEATGLYLQLDGLRVPPIPNAPTLDDARQALLSLQEVLKDFPFVGSSDLASALALILTTLVRKRLRSAPLGAIGAPKMASGKTLLADLIAMIGTGRPASVMSQGRDEEEIRKRIFSLLLEGESVACIDNIERPLGGDTLCSVLTSEYLKDRILGKSETAIVPTHTTWLATGNNLTIQGDLTTRVIPCTLDPGCEHPEAREFSVNLHKLVPEIRGQLIAAGLTIQRAYIEAGSPSQGLPRFGRFEEWDDIVRSPLVWAGTEDPCEGRTRIEADDPVRLSLMSLMSHWHAELREQWITVAEVLRGTVGREPEREETPLYVCLRDISASGARPDPGKIAKWLSKYANRIEGGMVIERGELYQGTRKWRVRRVER